MHAMIFEEGSTDFAGEFKAVQLRVHFLVGPKLGYFKEQVKRQDSLFFANRIDQKGLPF